jgi:hypothetical protein
MAYGMNRPRDAFFHQTNRLSKEEEKRLFDNAIRALEADVMSIGMHLKLDATARYAYRNQIALMSSKIQIKVDQGQISWMKAAEQAQETRNLILEISRSHSTPVGRAVAERMKREGKTFTQLIEKNTKEIFGTNADFRKLDASRKNAVYAAIVKSSGSSRLTVSRAMNLAGPAGRGLIIISLAISVYTVATAEDKLAAASREASIAGIGFGGALVGGAVAGLACGPAAPICVSIGAFVSGTLAAFGTSAFW